jgi:hypothetical protein
MHICNKRIPHAEPSLKLYKAEIPVVSEAKFLGIIFYSKLIQTSHSKSEEEVSESNEPAACGCTHRLGS